MRWLRYEVEQRRRDVHVQPCRPRGETTNLRQIRPRCCNWWVDTSYSASKGVCPNVCTRWKVNLSEIEVYNVWLTMKVIWEIRHWIICGPQHQTSKLNQKVEFLFSFLILLVPAWMPWRLKNFRLQSFLILVYANVCLEREPFGNTRVTVCGSQ